MISINIFALESKGLKQQNVLQTKDLIAREEQIAKNFEKYILENLSLPTIENLKTNNYLGTNFSLANRFGDSLDFKNASNLQLKYAVTKTGLDNYIKQLYNRDLYRKYTFANENTTTPANSNILIKLQSEEAKNILNILRESGAIIESSCPPSSPSRYCNVNEKAIRWYNSTLNWIEYNKKDYKKGNVTLESSSLLSDDKLEELPVGTYIYLKNGTKYIKLVDDPESGLKILKVD